MDEIDIYLQEDLNKIGDITSDSLFNDEKANAHIIAKNKCIIAGLEETKTIFQRTGAKTKLLVNDGDLVKEQTIIVEISGPVQSILKGERLALNIISRMSGIATNTKKLVDHCKKINPKMEIAATRKTTPGFRKFEKKAVILGGGEAHRYGLFDVVMIKDNHIKRVGSVEEAVKRIKQKVTDKKIEVEVENEQDALTVAKMNIDVIMLDNLDPRTTEKIVKKIREINKENH